MCAKRNIHGSEEGWNRTWVGECRTEYPPPLAVTTKPRRGFTLSLFGNFCIYAAVTQGQKLLILNFLTKQGQKNAFGWVLTRQNRRSWAIWWGEEEEGHKWISCQLNSFVCSAKGAEKSPYIVIFTLSIPSRTRSFGPSYVYLQVLLVAVKGPKVSLCLVKYLFAEPNAAVRQANTPKSAIFNENHAFHTPEPPISL